MGGSQSSHAVLDGDGGCYSVKCRSEPLMVHDRAVLRVTKEELRVLRAVDINGVYEPASDSPSDVLLQLRWDDIALITLAGRFLSLAQYTPAAVRGGQPGRLVHVFKLRKASNVNSLTNLVRVHSEWRASRPYLDPAEVEANLNKSRADRGPPSEVFRAANSWDKYREEDAPPPSVFSREANGRFSQAPSSSSSGSAPPLPPRSTSGGAPALGWTTFNNQAADPQPPPSSNNWSVNRQPSGAPLQLGYGGGYDAPASTAAPADPFAMTPPSVGPGAIPITHMNSGVPGSVNGDGASPSMARMSSGTIREQLARQYSNQYGDGPGTPGSGPGSVSPYSTQQPPASRAAPPPPMSVPVQNSLIDL